MSKLKNKNLQLATRNILNVKDTVPRWWCHPVHSGVNFHTSVLIHVYLWTWNNTTAESPFCIALGGGGHSQKLGYTYARTARVWFLPISVLERIGFWKLVLKRVGIFGYKFVLERVGFFKEFTSTRVILQISGTMCQFFSGIEINILDFRDCVNLHRRL